MQNCLLYVSSRSSEDNHFLVYTQLRNVLQWLVLLTSLFSLYLRCDFELRVNHCKLIGFVCSSFPGTGTERKIGFLPGFSSLYVSVVLTLARAASLGL